MAKVSPQELEALAHKELNAQMAWVEELFSNIRSQTGGTSPDRLRVVRNLLSNRIAKIYHFLDEYEIRYQ